MLTLLFVGFCKAESGIRIVGGDLTRISVKVSESVPKHLCYRTLTQLEVNWVISNYCFMYIVKFECTIFDALIVCLIW